MSQTEPTSLPPEKLRTLTDPAELPYADSTAIPANGEFKPAQPRALMALDMGLTIGGMEHHVYLAGDPNLGRTYMVRNFLAPKAAELPTPPDWIYVTNFDDPDRPMAVSLAPGQGKAFKTGLAEAVRRLRDEIPIKFEHNTYVQKREKMFRRFNESRNQLISKMEAKAADEGFNLNLDDSGAISLYPLVEGKVVGTADFDRLEPKLRDRLKKRGDKLLDAMLETLRKINVAERGLHDDELALDRDLLESALKEHYDPFAATYADNPKLADHLAATRRDFIENLDRFKPRDIAPPAAPDQTSALAFNAEEDFFIRYEVNLVVDNSGLSGAPVVVFDHPNYFNLLGCMERESEWGALFTDFTLIKPGAVHKANGGFLILHVEDLLQNPVVWEGLMRALRSRQARIDDPGDHFDIIRTRTIEPEAIPLSLRVILIGPDEIREDLLAYDQRFSKLFKLKAHMQDTVPRTPDTIDLYLRSVGTIIRESALLPFEGPALAGLVDNASLLAEDQEKLSLALPLARELMIEASALARSLGQTMVSREILHEADKRRIFRHNLYEEQFMAEYDRELFKVSTSGMAVGRANGLSVSMYGDYELGLPHQISCTVGVGHGGVLDLEREAELGGPIHTKGMMIIRSYLTELFAQDKPLVFTGSLCFEQNYAGVEGDSASGAEMAALLSALARTPNSLSLAFTGALSQSGAIMAVGGVNRKIEGFFEVCRRRGLTGSQGVILPKDNVVHLMLKDEVVDAVRAGLFHIHPVTRIEEAMTILTGLPTGSRTKSGQWTSGSLYRLVDDRLQQLAELAENDRPKKKPVRKKTKAKVADTTDTEQ